MAIHMKLKPCFWKVPLFDGIFIDSLNNTVSADERSFAQLKILRLHNETLKLTIDLEQHKLSVSASLISAKAGGSLGCNKIGAPSPCTALLGRSSPIVAVC